MIDGPEARLVATARSGNRQALAELVERCGSMVDHLVGYGLAGHPDPGAVARDVMQRIRRDVHQVHDPAEVRAWIAMQTRWRVRQLREPDHLGARVDGLGLTGEALRIAEAARRLTPEDRDTFALRWLCAAGVLNEAEAARVLGVVDAEYHGRRMLTRLDAARTVLAALTATPACPARPAAAASPGPEEFLQQSRHVQGCPACARYSGSLPPVMPVLAAAGPVRLPGGAGPHAPVAALPQPRQPLALPAAPAAADVTAVLVPVAAPADLIPALRPVAAPADVNQLLTPVEVPADVTVVLTPGATSAEVTTRLPVPVAQASGRSPAAADRRFRLYALAALVLACGVVVVINLPGNPVLGPLVEPSAGGVAGAPAPTGPREVVDAAVPDSPGGGPGVGPPRGTAVAPAGGAASPVASGPGPAGQPATTTPSAPATTPPPLTLFSDDFSSASMDGWSKSGGAWRVVADGGNQVLRQGNPTPGLSRAFNGDIGWTDYSVRARVKPLSFGSSGLAGITARAGGVANYYRLALTADGRAVLQAYAGTERITTLAGVALSVTTGTWYDLRIDVAGNTITGYVDGQRIGSGAGTLGGSGQIGLQTNLATAEFDDVIVTAGG
ncbi:LamG-like jellyroll fold domain-containing protein [Actinoplanes sp. NPDC026670]|uniref:LamG-like jellyroll fold domain-containing protein n=1 Tax=Actinoplanes sp. NPDC026670 TaxID=3154700 RepID=UPI0033CD303F